MNSYHENLGYFSRNVPLEWCHQVLVEGFVLGDQLPNLRFEMDVCTEAVKV